MNSGLTNEDVERLTQDRSADVRAETATKVAASLDASLTVNERELANDVCRQFVHDAAVEVRAALAESLKQSDAVPHDIAASLAADAAEVALPILQFSQVLTDQDLLEIIGADDPKKQVAIARRETVSADVADALVETHNEDVVAELVANDGAEIREETFEKVLDEFQDSDRVKTPMVYRKRLPMAVAEQLVSLVSERLCDHLMTHHELPESLRTDLLLKTRERAVMTLSSTETAGELVEALAQNGRLTGSIIIRAICMGDMPFFEFALAHKAEVPIDNARVLIHDEGPLGLKAIYRKAHLSDKFFPIARAAIDVSHETDYDGDDHDRERYCRRMIERVMTQFEEPSANFDQENVEYLLDKINELSAAGASVSVSAAQ